MKIIFCLLTAAAIGFCAACAPAMAAPIAQSIPEENRSRSVEEAHAIYKANSAKKVIEEKGDDAFAQFRSESDKWLTGEEAIFVIDATEGNISEGVFIVYPPIERMAGNAPDTSTTNGRRLARKAVKDSGQETDWLGFVEGEPGESAYATAVSVAPGGKKYVVIVGLQEQAQ